MYRRANDVCVYAVYLVSGIRTYNDLLRRNTGLYNACVAPAIMMCSRYFILIWVCLLTVSCNEKEEISKDNYVFEDFFFETMEDQQVQERTWSNISVNRLFEIPVEGEVTLYKPYHLLPDVDGNVYVVDYAIYKILRFDSKGKYVRSYGGGMGRGPGEFASVTDVGIVRDSIIYVVDPTNRRILFFAKEDGSLIDTRTSREAAYYRYVVTDTGIEYVKPLSHKYPFESRTGKEVVGFGKLLQNHEAQGHLLTSGQIHAYKEWMIYVPYRYPVIMIYDRSGNLVRAKKIINYDSNFKEPRIVENEIGGMVGYKPEGEPTSIESSVYEDELFVFAKAGDQGAIDVYEAESAEYKYSFRTPEPRMSYVKKNRMYQVVGDTTVVVYSIDGSR